MVTAFHANDAAAVDRVLERYPELKSRLDEPAPGAPFGATALLEAVKRGNREMVDVLLRAGADINARSHWWAGSFGVLDHDHDPDFRAFLIERGAAVDIHAAARFGMLDRLDELLSADPTLVHARGGDGQTPLHFAKTVEVARYLLDRGADIDARDIDHEGTPAQWMVRDRPDVARHLVERGGTTDILLAAALGDISLVRKHLEADPQCIQTRVTEQYFPRRDPRAGGHIYIWTLGSNKTAHMVARELGHREVFRLLMERSSDSLKLAVACWVGDKPLADALIADNPRLPASLSEEDRRGLPQAAQENKTDSVRLMLSLGWPVDARGQHNGTALHWAAFHGNAEMARTILEYRPSLELHDRDFDGTPLGWALHGSVHGWHCDAGDYAGVVEALLDAGARPPSPDSAARASETVRTVLRARGLLEE
ncbi:MAG: ankyrin repeat domain-containing protein [Gemmatimonadota bacterium]|nr:ankyrin repeat domain-containing protein [Gemmatimonadota bacterium]